MKVLYTFNKSILEFEWLLGFFQWLFAEMHEMFMYHQTKQKIHQTSNLNIDWGGYGV